MREMKLSGKTSPSSGCCHRDRASNAGDGAGCDVDLRLVVDHEFVAVEGPNQIFVWNRDSLFVSGDQAGFSAVNIGAQKFLQLCNRKRLLEVADDDEAQRLSQFLGGFDDADVDPAHQNDARLAVSLAQQPQDLDSIHLRHDEIEQNEGGVRSDAVEKVFRSAGYIALQPHCLCQCRDDFANDAVVVNQHYPVTR